MASGSEAATLPATAPRMAEPTQHRLAAGGAHDANAASVGQQLTHQRMLPAPPLMTIFSLSIPQARWASMIRRRP